MVSKFMVLVACQYGSPDRSLDCVPPHLGKVYGIGASFQVIGASHSSTGYGSIWSLVQQKTVLYNTTNSNTSILQADRPTIMVREDPTDNSTLRKKAWGNGILNDPLNLRVGPLVEGGGTIEG